MGTLQKSRYGVVIHLLVGRGVVLVCSFSGRPSFDRVGEFRFLGCRKRGSSPKGSLEYFGATIGLHLSWTDITIAVPSFAGFAPNANTNIVTSFRQLKGLYLLLSLLDIIRGHCHETRTLGKLIGLSRPLCSGTWMRYLDEAHQHLGESSREREEREWRYSS